MNRKSKDSTRELASIRDTVQSVWVAIILAFVLRAFLVEAFVIPTGSMAPTLMGQHWQVECPSCHYQYAYGLSNPDMDRRLRRQPLANGAECPNCDMPFDHAPQRPAPGPADSGDRVLVLKYLYQFREPQPWDVVVFRNPQNNRENYIKRLIGLPGETIEIVHGQIFVAEDPAGPFRIRRKPDAAQEALWQPLFLNDFQPDEQMLLQAGVPRQQQRYWDMGPDAARWARNADGRVFHYLGGAEAELRLNAPRHAFLPHYGYNSRLAEGGQIDTERDIATDLKLSLVFFPQADDSSIRLQLTGLDSEFQALVRADGTLELAYRHPERLDGQPVTWEGRLDPLRTGRGYEIALTHVDFQATLWVNGRRVLETTEEVYWADYDSLKERIAQVPQRPIPTPLVAIVAGGGPSELRRLTVMRDVFHTQQTVNPGDIPIDVRGSHARQTGQLPEPRGGWGTSGHPITLRRFADSPDYDEFYTLGDNSPQSLDSRGWVQAAPTLRLDTPGSPYQLGTVPRYNMIGRALFVYWPAGHRLPPGIPIIPNVGRMRLIH